jgi:hypothetical protein
LAGAAFQAEGAAFRGAAEVFQVVVEVFQAAVEVSFPLSCLLTKWKKNVRDPAIPVSVAAWKVEEVSRQLCKITRPVTTTDKTCFKISRFNRSYR